MSNDGFNSVERLTRCAADPPLPIPIRTARLELRPFRETDIARMADLLADPIVTQYIGGPQSGSEVAKTVIRMRDRFAARGWGTLAVVPLEEDGCVGYCGVRPLTHTADVEVAFALQQRCWRLGYATEAAVASIDATFHCIGVESIVATVYPQNTASCRVLAKLGMKQQPSVFGIWPRESALLYRIRREEWNVRIPLT
jgi:RimJ/RimL family protein N-acetyltransferase